MSNTPSSAGERQAAAKSTQCFSSLFAAELVACIAERRDPTAAELNIVAMRIQAEARTGAPWPYMAAAEESKRWALAAARLALEGEKASSTILRMSEKRLAC